MREGLSSLASAHGAAMAPRAPGVSNDADAQVLQVLRRQVGQDLLADLILAECRLILFEAKPPQPTSDIHGGAPVRLALHDPPAETACLG